MSFVPLVNVDVSRAVSRYNERSSTLEDNWFLLGAILALLLFWVGLYYWDKYRKKTDRQVNYPQELFLELCQKHRLNRSERSLLWHAAEQAYPNQPAVVFVDPRILKKRGESDAENASEYGQLARKIFPSSMAVLEQAEESVVDV